MSGTTANATTGMTSFSKPVHVLVLDKLCNKASGFPPSSSVLTKISDSDGSTSIIEKSHELRLPAGHAYATSGLTRLDDGMRDDVAMLRRREKVEERQASAALSRPAWDPSQWRYCPPALMGLKPMTTEPWARDIEVYQAG